LRSGEGGKRRAKTVGGKLKPNFFKIPKQASYQQSETLRYSTFKENQK